MNINEKQRHRQQDAYVARLQSDNIDSVDHRISSLSSALGFCNDDGVGYEYCVKAANSSNGINECIDDSSRNCSIERRPQPIVNDCSGECSRITAAEANKSLWCSDELSRICTSINHRCPLPNSYSSSPSSPPIIQEFSKESIVCDNERQQFVASNDAFKMRSDSERRNAVSRNEQCYSNSSRNSCSFRTTKSIQHIDADEELLLLPSPAMLNDMMSRIRMYTPAQNSVTQSNILAQHQQQYQAPRYPSPSQNTSGISQCYPQSAQPQLVSPNQASAVQAITPQSTSSATQMVSAVATSANISRNMEVTNNSGTIVPQHARIASQSTPFYGHSNPVQGDMCLLGCHFIVIEYERILFDRMDALEISAVVRMHGGEIEFGCRSYSAHSDRLTHVICESVRHSLVPQALKDRKRCVTLNWLNDVLTKKHLEVPWRVYHLPSVWAENQRPALGKLIATYRFCDYERTGVRFMIDAIGARYTPYITRQNHYLVVKSSDNEITEKCRELGITMVSYQWLVDAYLGLKNFNEGENAYYPTPNMISDVNISPYSLENYCDLCKQLLAPWRSPIMISNEQWQRAAEIKRSVENDETIFPNKKLRCSTPPPTEEQIALKLREVKKLYNPSVICFTGFSPEEMDALGKKIRFLGGKVTDSVVECTHLVVLNLWRTMKLLQAIALGKNIVGFNWITDGYRHQSFPDTLDYFMRDDENEKAYGYNLKFSVLKARYRKIFQDVIFYLTPSVEPSRDSLASLITMAGGKVLEEKPDPKFVARRIESESPLLLISNESDIHLLQYLTDCAMPVFNVEIVLTGILRQKLENSPLYRVATAQRSPLNQSSLQNQPHTAAPVQKAVA